MTSETPVGRLRHLGRWCASPRRRRAGRGPRCRSATRAGVAGAVDIALSVYVGSFSRASHVFLKPGRAWQAASHAFTLGAASNRSGAAWA